MGQVKELYFYQNGCQSNVSKKDDLSFLNYLESLDPIVLKYEIESPIPEAARAKAAEFEKRFQYSSITKQQYSYISDNLRLVYGKGSNIVENDIRAFHQVETRLICGYFGIPQLNQMFDEDYFNFEWDMHVGNNLKEHRSDYYRDHFVHQIRNLYMMLNLLDEFGFYNACKRILKTPNASKVSEYVCKKSMAFCTEAMGAEQQRLKLILEDYQDYYYDKYLEKYKEEHKVNDDFAPTREEAIPLIYERTSFASHESFLGAYFYKYVIYASTILSALFHDMGYPICHFLEVRRRISEYNPAMYMFTHNAVESFDQLAFKLGSSLLFSIVSPDIVRKRLEPRKKGGYDHGAYSAIAFLQQFYDTGVIYSLSVEKQCAIELAALAIFNHTSKFKIISKKEDTRYYNMYFRQNPVSFLLRFCDDLQEWDRRYFEISETSDLLFCPKCGLPMLKLPKYNDKGEPLLYSEYRCGCKKPEISRALVRPNVFIKRKIYLVTVADWVRLRLEDQQDSSKKLIATINYDLYKLLLMAKTNDNYASFRLKELNEVKKLLSDQDFAVMSDGILDFSNINLDYYMTYNPVLIKVWILERYIRRTNALSGSHQKLDTEMELSHLCSILESAYKNKDTRKENGRTIFDSVFNQNNATEEGSKQSGKMALENHLLSRSKEGVRINGALDFYLLLLHDCLLKKERMSDKLYKYIAPFKNDDPMYYGIMCSFIQDCLRQYRTPCSSLKPYIEKEKEKAFQLNVNRYTDAHNYFNNYDATGHLSENPKESYPYIGYYKDIYLFYLMNKASIWAPKNEVAVTDLD